MAFRAVPTWGKVLIGGGGAVGIFAAYKAWYPSAVESYKTLAMIPEADLSVQQKCDAAFAKLQASDSKSLLKKHLTQSVLDKCKARKTNLGATLFDVIASGAENLDSGVGLYAPDIESYRTFHELFDAVIEDYHGGQRQPAVDLGENKLDQLVELDKEGKYIISTRIRCGRTIKGFPMNPLLREDDYLVLEQKIKTALQTFKDPELDGTYYPLLGMGKDVQKQLIDDHFLFKEGDRFLQAANACRFWPKGRGIFHNKDKTFLVWVNEEDHMRIISMQQGGDVGKVLDRLIRGVKEIEKKVPFARDERFGWIMFCPSNLGTTVRASVHVKLPKLAARKDFNEICEKMNLQVRGIHGEHSESKGGVYDISNKQRMGITEFEAVKQMYDGVKTLIDMEKKA